MHLLVSSMAVVLTSRSPYPSTRRVHASSGHNGTIQRNRTSPLQRAQERIRRWRKSERCQKLFVDPDGHFTFDSMAVPAIGSPTAKFILGSARAADTQAEGAPKPPRPPAGVCGRLGEQAAFETLCASERREMDELLARTRGRRGLAIEFVGRNVWGVGHVLSLAYVAHYVCRRLRRYCYVRLWDSQLEDLFTYANGESWAPTARELARYDAAHSMSFTAPESQQMSVVFKHLRNESAPLIRVILHLALPSVATLALPWLLPVSATARGGGGDGSRADRAIDRCFCRYVSQPSFGAEGDAIAAAVAQRFRRSTDRDADGDGAHGGTVLTPTIALHLRTGLADMPDRYLLRLTRPVGVPPQSGPAQWFEAACEKAAFEQMASRALIVSDAPGLMAHLLRAYPRQLHAVPPLQNARNVNGSSRSTRSWSNGFGPKLGTSASDQTLSV